MERKKIIILHGWSSNPRRWSIISRLLKKDGFGIEVPHIPGFDEKKQLKSPYDIDNYVVWLKAYLKNIKGKVNIVGHSNGGRIAIAYCARYKNKANKLILINSAGIPPKNALKTTVFKLVAKIGKKVLFPLKKTPIYELSQRLIYKLSRESDYLNASPVMKKTMQKLLSYNCCGDLSKIQIPTLCIWGEKDKETPLWMGKTMNKKLINSTIILLSSGHNPHRTNPSKLSSIISQYLSQ